MDMLRFRSECPIREHHIFVGLRFRFLFKRRFQSHCFLIGLISRRYLTIETWIEASMLADDCCGRNVLAIFLMELNVVACGWIVLLEAGGYLVHLHLLIPWRTYCIISHSIIALNRNCTISLILQLSVLRVALRWFLDLHHFVPWIIHCLFILEERVQMISTGFWRLNSTLSILLRHHEKASLQLSGSDRAQSDLLVV